MDVGSDLLTRLGGPDAVRAVANGLYDRLLVDDEIGPLFAETHMPTMRERLAEYLIAALEGREAVSAKRLRAAHAEHQVDDRHFSILASHLVDLLEDARVDPDTAADLLEFIASKRTDIVSHSVVAGGGDPIDPF